MPKIVIDPGHYPGCRNKGPTGYYEFAGMWTLSNYLKSALERRGCTAVLTRLEDQNPSLAARGAAAKGADLFISEHSNAANGAVRGAEVFYSLKRPDDKQLAAGMSGAVSLAMGNPDRGAKTRQSTKSPGSDYYSVIASASRTDCPHILLVESGFHDNPLDEAFLKSDSRLEFLAEAQADVICRALGGDLTPIVGASAATAAMMAGYIKSKNPSVQQSVVDMLPLYISEGAAEGIRGDAAFAQSCIETGNFTFKGSKVTLDQNNFCGLGVTSNGVKGASFASPRDGIRAQIQHLKAYANTEPLNSPAIDLRFSLVTRGCAPYIEWLGQKENPNGSGWATGKDYGAKILKILGAVLKTPDTTGQPSAWAREAWAWGTNSKITDGTNPQATPSREQVIQMIYNFMVSKE